MDQRQLAAVDAPQHERCPSPTELALSQDEGRRARSASSEWSDRCAPYTAGLLPRSVDPDIDCSRRKKTGPSSKARLSRPSDTLAG